MPDQTKQTISATQAPGLFGVSPYVTRWMLWHHFANGVSLDVPENDRMAWGTKMQPLILEQAAQELKLEVRPNADYYRRGQLGCTRDATVICPDRGPGALETKCVFDYGVWMRDWDGGKTPPRHHEIQLQQQMLVGDGESAKSYEWGVLAAWVCGEVHYFERKPIGDLWERLNSEASAFFAEVNEKREPNPFGASPELDWLTKLLPTVKGKVLDLSESPDAVKIAEKASLYKTLKEDSTAQGKAAEAIRGELLALAKDAEQVVLPGGVRLKISTRNVAEHIRKASTSKTLSVFVPNDTATLVPASNIGEVIYAG